MCCNDGIFMLPMDLRTAMRQQHGDVAVTKVVLQSLDRNGIWL